MRFIIYDATPLEPSTHRVLRWGDAPEETISAQAGSGEVAIPAPAGWPVTPNTADGGYTYNTSTGAVVFFGVPYVEPYEDKVTCLCEEIRAALRDTQWALLSDSWLNSTQQTEMINWRAWVRAIPASGSGWANAVYNLTPPYSEF